MGKYHDILGVDPKASMEDIKAAYKKLALELHPDKTGGDKTAEDKLKEVNEAYTALKKGQSGPDDDLTNLRNAYNDVRQQTRQTIQAVVPLNILFTGGTHTIISNFPVINGMMLSFNSVRLDINIPPNHPIDRPLEVQANGSKFSVMLQPGSLDNRDIAINQVFQDGKPVLNMHEEVEVDVFTAMLGGKFDFHHPSGKTLKVTVPNSGATSVRLPKKGLSMSTSGPGDYILHIRLKMPTWNEEQRQILREAVEKINQKS